MPSTSGLPTQSDEARSPGIRIASGLAHAHQGPLRGDRGRQRIRRSRRPAAWPRRASASPYSNAVGGSRRVASRVPLRPTCAQSPSGRTRCPGTRAGWRAVRRQGAERRSSGAGGRLRGRLVDLRQRTDASAPGFFDNDWPRGCTRAALDPYYDLVAHMLDVQPVQPNPTTREFPRIAPAAPFGATQGPTITTASIFDRQDADRRVWFAIEDGGYSSYLAPMVPSVSPARLVLQPDFVTSTSGRPPATLSGLDHPWPSSHLPRDQQEPSPTSCPLPARDLGLAVEIQPQVQDHAITDSRRRRPVSVAQCTGVPARRAANSPKPPRDRGSGNDLRL
jgi:hypothetical protein